MKKPKEDYSTRTIKTPDGLKITFLEKIEMVSHQIKIHKYNLDFNEKSNYSEWVF
jgi:hypothetical protein